MNKLFKEVKAFVQFLIGVGILGAAGACLDRDRLSFENMVLIMGVCIIALLKIEKHCPDEGVSENE